MRVTGPAPFPLALLSSFVMFLPSRLFHIIRLFIHSFTHSVNKAFLRQLPWAGVQALGVQRGWGQRDRLTELLNYPPSQGCVHRGDNFTEEHLCREADGRYFTESPQHALRLIFTLFFRAAIGLRPGGEMIHL